MHARVQPFTATHESPLDALRRWAAGASSHLLKVLAVAGATGTAGVVIIDANQLVFCAPMISMASLGAWGLLRQRNLSHPSRGAGVLSVLLAIIGTVALTIGFFGLLIWVMGPAPVL